MSLKAFFSWSGGGVGVGGEKGLGNGGEEIKHGRGSREQYLSELQLKLV